MNVGMNFAVKTFCSCVNFGEFVFRIFVLNLCWNFFETTFFCVVSTG